MDNLEKFLTAYAAGNLEPFLKSEPVPDNSNNAVKVKGSYGFCQCLAGCNNVCMWTARSPRFRKGNIVKSVFGPRIGVFSENRLPAKLCDPLDPFAEELSPADSGLLWRASSFGVILTFSNLIIDSSILGMNMAKRISLAFRWP